jgi:hypothetical protein
MGNIQSKTAAFEPVNDEARRVAAGFTPINVWQSAKMDGNTTTAPGTTPQIANWKKLSYPSFDRVLSATRQRICDLHRVIS